jgi:hypothetical protein
MPVLQGSTTAASNFGHGFKGTNHSLNLCPFGTILDLMAILVFGKIYSATETDRGFGKDCAQAL